MNQDKSDCRASRVHRLIVLLPLAIFGAVAALFFFRLGAGDSTRLPSALINKPAPAFTLKALDGLAGIPGLSDADLKRGSVTLVNVFASWCVPCHQEHPTLMRLAADKALAGKGLRIVGLAYKDPPENARRFLGEAGNPYQAVGTDQAGRAAIDWGVYGVPESFIVKGDGTIAYKFVGPMSEQALASVILPEIVKAMR